MPVTFISNTSSGGAYIVPQNTIILQNSATVPSGFIAYTSLNGKYVVPVVSGSGLSDGGNSTHNHSQTKNSVGTSGAHAHTPTGTSNGPSSTEQFYNAGNPGWVFATTNHTHSLQGDTTESGGHSHDFSNSVSSDATNLPEYISLCAFKANTANSELPVGAIIMWYGGAIPSKFALCDGSGGRVDMRSHFLHIDSSPGSGGTNVAHSHTLGALALSGNHTHNYNQNTNAASIFTSYANYYPNYPRDMGAGSHSSNVLEDTDEIGEHIHAAFSSNINTVNTPSINLYFIQYTG